MLSLVYWLRVHLWITAPNVGFSQLISLMRSQGDTSYLSRNHKERVWHNQSICVVAHMGYEWSTQLYVLMCMVSLIGVFHCMVLSFLAMTLHGYMSPQQHNEESMALSVDLFGLVPGWYHHPQQHLNGEYNVVSGLIWFSLRWCSPMVAYQPQRSYDIVSRLVWSCLMIVIFLSTTTLPRTQYIASWLV